jgi:SAM-dependent methyltransferase
VSEDFVCPACRAAVFRTGEAYRCSACKGEYPILFGIPDFRLRPDAYLSLVDERAKAAKLDQFGRSANFSALVDYYYAITDDVPASLVPIFAGYVHDATNRSRLALDRLGQDPRQGALLDLGCGSGGALIAASGSYLSCTGVDVALRWLVIAQKRLTEAGIQARLVCANAEALPFPQATFTHVLADDLIDNVCTPNAVLREAAAAMHTGGRLLLSAGNRRWIGPHPATGVWAAGLIPHRWRKARLERKYGFDLLRAISLQTPVALRRMAAPFGLKASDVRPRYIDLTAMRGRSTALRMLAHFYRAICRIPGLRAVLTDFGPTFEIIFSKSDKI